MIVAVTVAPVVAQQEDVTEHVSLELDAGFYNQYDDSGLWDSGVGAGISGLWAVDAALSLGARFSVTHWSYVPSSIVAELTPMGAAYVSEESSGQVQVVSLTPLVRYQRERVVGKLGAFVAAGPGVAYLKEHATTDVYYTRNGARDRNSFEIENSAFKVTFEAMTGLGHAVSSSSSLELIAFYRFIDEHHLYGVGAGFYLRV